MDNLKELLPDLPCPIIDEPMLHRFLAFGDADRWGKRRRTAGARRPLADALRGDVGGDSSGRHAESASA
jgi:hypothetical protein